MNRLPARALLPIVVSGVLLAGCSTGATVPTAGASAGTGGSIAASPSGAAVPAGASAAPIVPFTPAATPTIMPSGAYSKPSQGGPRLAPTAAGALTGKIILVDPGHNGAYAPSLHNKRVPSVLGPFQCMASGTETTDRKFSEHAINWAVGTKLSDALRAQGATVVLSRPDDNGVGPCNSERAELANAVGADFLISVHVDGQFAGRHGFDDPTGFHTQLETKMVGGKPLFDRSKAGAQNVIRRMLEMTDQPLTNYIPRKPAGIWERTGELTVLAGLKKTPGVLVEMGNIQNPKDLAKLTNGVWQTSVANALTAAIVDTLTVPEYMTPSPVPSATPTGSVKPTAPAAPASAGASAAATAIPAPGSAPSGAAAAAPAASPSA